MYKGDIKEEKDEDKDMEKDVEKDLIEFERDVICEFEKTQGPSLWETVISSLNEDARSIVTDSRMPSRRSSHIDFNDNYNNSNYGINDSINKKINYSVDTLQGINILFI